MFSYCLNNPTSNSDPSGNSAISVCNGDRNPLFIGHIGLGGGGGGGCSGGYTTNVSANTSGHLSDHQEYAYGGTSHGKILPWEFDLFSFTHEGLVIVDAEVALTEGSIDWDHATLTLAKLFSAEASAGLTKEDGLHLEAMASVASSGLLFTVGSVEIVLIGHIGAVGGKLSINSDGMAVGLTHAGLGGEFAIRWDVE